MRWKPTAEERALVTNISTPKKDRWLALCEHLGAVEDAPNRREAIRELERISGLSEKTIYRKLQKLRDEGPLSLLDSRLVPSETAREKKANSGLPLAFLEFWHGYLYSNQRKVEPAYRQMFADIREGKVTVIPGYGTWQDIYRMEFPGCEVPATCPYEAYKFVPAGWSRANLNNYKPSKYALDVARIGRRHARKHLPPVATTRVGMRVGQVYMWDDVWPDNEVVLPGAYACPVRPIELGCLDVFSGCYVKWGMMPRMFKDDGTRRNTTQEDFLFIMLATFRDVGYLPKHLGGTLNILEHGTANIRANIEKLFSLYSDGAIQFDRSGIHNQPLIKGLAEYNCVGNSKFKAALESHHNLKHNELAAVPGQIGKDRDHCPEWKTGRDKRNHELLLMCMALMEKGDDIAARAAEKLRFDDMITWSEFYHIACASYDRMNRREHHHLEGFEEAGLTRTLYRIYQGMGWVPREQLIPHNCDATQAAAIEAAIRMPGNMYTRRMSPQEVFDQGKAALVKLPDEAVPHILGAERGRVLSVAKDHTFSFQDKARYGVESRQQYFSFLTDPKGRELVLDRGKFMCHVNPLFPEEMFVSTLEYEYIGVASSINRPCRTDRAAVVAEAGRQLHQEKLLAEPWIKRGLQIVKERGEDAELNSEFIARALGTPPQDREAARHVEEPESFNPISHLIKKGRRHAAQLEEATHE